MKPWHLAALAAAVLLLAFKRRLPVPDWHPVVIDSTGVPVPAGEVTLAASPQLTAPRPMLS